MPGERRREKSLSEMLEASAYNPLRSAPGGKGRASELLHPLLREEPKSAPRESPPGDLLEDPVNSPSHYTSHPSGVECIQITEHMNFNLGNAMKYLWRADLKGGVEDLEKAAWYIAREISRRKATA